MKNLNEAVEAAVAAIGAVPMNRGEIIQLVDAKVRDVHPGKSIGNAIDRRLAALTESGELLREYRDGKFVHYRPDNSHVVESPATAKPQPAEMSPEIGLGLACQASDQIWKENQGKKAAETDESAGKAAIVVVTRFRTPDGREHATREEAEDWLIRARRRTMVDEFIAENWVEGRDEPDWLRGYIEQFAAWANL